MHDRRRPLAVFVLTEVPEPRQWQPLADVYKTRAGWVLKFDLAGVRPEDVVVQVTGSRVTVTGVRRDCTIEEGCVHYSMEISYNRFARTIQLPVGLEDAGVSIEYRDGNLFVKIDLP